MGLLALAGCGGSSGLSKAKLAAKANAICADSTAAVKRVPAPGDFATNAASAAAYLDKVVRLEQAGVSQLKALKPGSDVKAAYHAYLADVDHELALVRGAARKAHAKDASGLQDLRALQTFEDKTAHPDALKAGLTTCASGA